MGSLHELMPLGTVHRIHNYEYDDLAAAQAASWSSSDIGKVFRITDEPNYYIIKTTSEFMKIGLGDTQTVSTTDATETSIGTYETANDYVYLVTSKILGTVNGGGNAAAYKRTAAFKNDSGTLSQIGSTATDFTAEDSAGWDVDIDSSGTDIRIRVAGAAATNIDWVAYTEIEVLDNGV